MTEFQEWLIAEINSHHDRAVKAESDTPNDARVLHARAGAFRDALAELKKLYPRGAGSLALSQTGTGKLAPSRACAEF